MAQIAIISVGISSCLNASFALANGLKASGHHITFVSAEPRAEPQVAAQGFDFRLLEEEAALEKEWRRSGLQRQPVYKRWLKRRAYIRARRPLYKHLVQSDEIDNIVSELQPDLLLLDIELYHHIIATAHYDVPTLILETSCAAPRALGVPILYSDFVPKGNLWDRPRAAASWIGAMAMRHSRFLGERLFYGGMDRISTLRALAKKRGFDLRKNAVMSQWRFLTFRHVDTLYLYASELDFPRPTPPPTDAKTGAKIIAQDDNLQTKSYCVGPMVMLDRTEPQTQNADYVAMVEKLELQNREQKAIPLIFCGMGSIFSNFDYFKRVIAAADLCPEWNFVLAVGRRLPLKKFGAVPENVHLFQTVPQLDLLKRADIMLNHGGIASIRECIFLGVPMIVYSNGHLDQDGDAARVVYHGLGLRGDIRREQPIEISTKIETVLTDARYRKNVEKMRASYHAYGGTKTAINIIDEMIQ